MKVLLASNNRGKLAELHAMFAPLGFELVRVNSESRKHPSPTARLLKMP